MLTGGFPPNVSHPTKMERRKDDMRHKGKYKYAWRVEQISSDGEKGQMCNEEKRMYSETMNS
jgi:hypothetical protein